MLQGPRMTIPLGKTKVNTIDKVAVPSTRIRYEIRGFNITMNQMSRMHEFDAFEHLIGHHEDGFQGKTTTALVELIFQGRTQQIHDHEIVTILRSKVMDLGKARSILEFPIHLVFVTELRTASAVFFEFDGDLE
jgi:hypothetical protein